MLVYRCWGWHCSRLQIAGQPRRGAAASILISSPTFLILNVHIWPAEIQPVNTLSVIPNSLHPRSGRPLETQSFSIALLDLPYLNLARAVELVKGSHTSSRRMFMSLCKYRLVSEDYPSTSDRRSLMASSSYAADVPGRLSTSETYLPR
jgi:hypothetical protein